MYMSQWTKSEKAYRMFGVKPLQAISIVNETFANKFHRTFI